MKFQLELFYYSVKPYGNILKLEGTIIIAFKVKKLRQSLRNWSRVNSQMPTQAVQLQVLSS
jgi:hypothetical protein